MIGIIDFLVLMYDEGGASIDEIKEIAEVMELRDEVPNPELLFQTWRDESKGGVKTPSVSHPIIKSDCAIDQIDGPERNAARLPPS